MDPQQSERRRIRCQSHKSDGTHREGVGQRAVYNVPYSGTDDPQAKSSHSRSLWLAQPMLGNARPFQPRKGLCRSLSRRPENRGRQPGAMPIRPQGQRLRPAPTSIKNIIALIARTAHSTRRYSAALPLCVSKFKGGGVQQQSAMSAKIGLNSFLRNCALAPHVCIGSNASF
jgi:hypothetical protein